MPAPGRSDSWDTWNRASWFEKTLGVSVWAIAMITLYNWGYLYLDYGSRMPLEPQPTIGRTHPFTFKNRTVYVTADEEHRATAAFCISVFCWITGVATFVILQRRTSGRAA